MGLLAVIWVIEAMTEVIYLAKQGVLALLLRH
jgi:hypothetical protein